MFRKLTLLLALLASVPLLAQVPPVNGPLIQLPNDLSTGTGANLLVSLTSTGNAIKFPHAQTIGVFGVAVYGAGTAGSVYVQTLGTIPIIADGLITAQHWVIPSTTTDGQIHDTGTLCTVAPPSSVDVVGCAISTGGGAGLPALIDVRTQFSAAGVTGTASLNCGVKGTGVNTIGCGASVDDGTRFYPSEILDIAGNAFTIENTTAAGTYTVGNLAVFTASNTVGDPATAAANIFAIGVNLAKNGAIPVTQITGKATVNSSSAVVFTSGDYVCTDAANAGKFVDNSSTPCTGGTKQMGFVAATDGGAQLTHTIILFIGTVASQTIASGSTALGTPAITANSCATVVTTSAPGVATTDAVTFSFNSDVTGVTGYLPVSTGGLQIFPFPSANNVNFRVCNPTSSTITPGAITINWRDVR